MKVVEKKKLGVETAGETEGARRATVVLPGGAAASESQAPEAGETEVVEKAQRRRFTAEDKRRIVREADRATTPGAIGSLLRREGLYSSLLTAWRSARDRGELEGLAPKKRGPKALPPDLRDKKIAEEEREMGKWRKRAERAEPQVGVQKNVAALLGTPFDSDPS